MSEQDKDKESPDSPQEVGADESPSASEPPTEPAAEAGEAASAAETAATPPAPAAETVPAAAREEASEEEAPKEPEPPWLSDPATPEWQDEDEDELVRSLRGSHEDAILNARSFAGDLTLTVRRDAIVEVARSLKEEHGFGYMVDVAGVDYPEREERFEVVYHVYNQSIEKRVRLKVSVGEDSEVPSVTPVWCGANWPEREAYDMYGIRFAGHPDLSRILLWEGFNGHPLRKEFPVEGIDTGAAIYPEYYDQTQGPISGEGTGWKIPEAPLEEVAAEADSAAPPADGADGGESS